MIASLLLEAALRSLLLASAVWIGLRLFAVRNVLAQKAAWGLVLASAVLMPVVLPMAARVPSALVIPAYAFQSLTAILPSRPLASPVSSAAAPTQLAPQPRYIAPQIAKPYAAHRTAIDPEPTAQFTPTENSAGSIDRYPADRYPAPAISQSPSLSAQREPVPLSHRFTVVQLAVFAYFAVAAALLLRLLYGLAVAVDVWQSAKAVRLETSALTRGLRLRSSDAISSPVTIGSSVVLPADYRDWDSEKLRIVLAHERSHIRQGDFYLQLLAAVYAALVWFSPLGWWLKRKLSDLAEAISDRAGLEEAADCTSYAQILLQFAAAPRPTPIGVAMARPGSLSRRIERLLNDVSFRQAFSGTRRALAIVLVIPVALFAATALLRVEAAGQQAPTATPASAPAPDAGAAAPQLQPAQAPAEGISDPSRVPTAPAPDEASPLPAAPAEVIAPPQDVHVPPINVHLPEVNVHVPDTEVHVPAIDVHVPANDIHVPAVNVHIPANDIHVPSIHVHTAEINIHARDLALALAQNGQISGNSSGYHYSYSTNGESYAILRGNDKEHMSFSGEWMEGRREELEKARKAAGGKDILWFTRNGKSYFVDDPATLAQVEAMYKPMEDLGRQQEELGKKQEALGKQQEELGRQQEAVSVPTPDMSKEIAEIDEAMAKLKASQGKNMNQEQFAEIQEKIGELQGKLGELQGEMGSRQGEFGAKMGELGSKQGELGSQQGRLGAEQGRLAQEADRKVKSIIDQSMKDRKAHPVE